MHHDNWEENGDAIDPDAREMAVDGRENEEGFDAFFDINTRPVDGVEPDEIDLQNTATDETRDAPRRAR